MKQILVDSNVLLDVLTEDPQWFDWSASALERHADGNRLCINFVIYTEVSVGFERVEDLEAALPASEFTRVAMPWDAAFLAGKAFVRYRKAGGERRSPLPDLFIGAHAAVADMRLLTRDASRYRTYFPRLELIAPP
jgi:predicted nucleic acid-binding protein